MPLIDEGIKIPSGNESAAIQPSAITKAKWREQFIETTKCVVIVDTNVLIHNDALLKELTVKSYEQSEVQKRFGVCIPYVVYVDELYRKKSPQIHEWISYHLTRDNNLTVKGPWKVPENLNDFFAVNNECPRRVKRTFQRCQTNAR